ncbi:transketolase [Helicovermis profundi]|uniref:Transketolase n=1 Tax=Helicovermis profundi TaxID=3065157 RepID=A0AAU9E4N9_9FIRM|nr:transketolase [Clostridia bacterium S502]
MKHKNSRVIETIRLLSVDAIEKANSGHPGLPLGAAPMAFALWNEFLNVSATETKWMNRDRFVLSAGHGSMLYYSLLHLFGYEISLDDLKNFRQLGSITPGHPEYNVTPGIETTTGPLGQGLGNAVGMAIAEKKLSAEFNTSDFNIIDHYTYVIAGDGDMMEGITSEAASLAGHLKLGKLIVLYDDNGITIDGSTDISFTEDVGARYRAYGWEVIEVKDGNNYGEIVDAINLARLNSVKPTLIKVKTIIGYGSPTKAGKSSVHGSPLGKDEIIQMKKNMGWDPDKSFYVPDDVKEYMKNITDKKEINRFLWEEKFEEYFKKYPEKESKWKHWFEYEISDETFQDSKIWSSISIDNSTRNSGGIFMNIVKEDIPNLFGGSADLNGSTKTYLKNLGDFSFENPSGSNVFFGIREHAMGAIINGIALHGGLRPFGATFLVFSDYMKPSIRLSALMGLPVIYVFTHDSIGVGEDGPTHQPIEQISMLRSIPNLSVFRPADGKETAMAWINALKRTRGPSAIILTRQNLPSLVGVNKGANYGAYILSKEIKEKPDAIIIASGSEVHVALEASKKLLEDGIDSRVVSMLSMEFFDKQNDSYKEMVLPSDVKSRVSIEAGIELGWRKYVGDKGKIISINHYGESAPANLLFGKFGFTSENIVKLVKEVID